MPQLNFITMSFASLHFIDFLFNENWFEGTFSQFHNLFSSNFCAKIFLPKYYKEKVEKSYAKHF